MSKHVWLTRPTAGKAAQLRELFRLARNAGATPEQARIFAGYTLEAVNQKGTGQRGADPRSDPGGTAARCLRGCVKTGWTITQARNAPHYRSCFNAHVPLILAPLLAAVGLAADCPIPILIDRLLENGRDREAEELREICSPL